MNGEHKKRGRDRALGESIASVPEIRAVKEEAARKLTSGEDSDSVFDHVAEGVQGITGELERLCGLDRSMAKWLVGWAETGEPGILDARLRGWAGPIPWTDEDGETVMMVVAVAGPTSSPEEIAADFLTICRKELPAECFKEKVHPERDARWFRLFKEGMSYRQIAELVLEEDGFDQRCASQDDWNEEVNAWANRISVACFRWQEHLTRMTDLA